MVSDLLFELGTEELPSGAVLPLAEALAELVTARFEKAGIRHGKVQHFATPRRVALWVHDVQEQQDDQAISRRGPAFAAGQDKNGAPTQALIGFAKSCGVDVAALKTVETEKGPWWYYESLMKGAKTQTLLPELLADALSALPITKPMRWGAGQVEFARPVHWAILCFGNEHIPCQLLGVQTGSKSYGHRFHHPQAIEITSAASYESTLRDAYVIADFAVRRETIREQIESIALAAGFNAVIPPALLDEVTAIVEWPVAMKIGFPAEFLAVPSEALIASMQSHQKCFALRDKEGHLVPYFITVANIKSHRPESVIAGNEKVMRARLSDAAFFFQKDKQQALHAYRASTANVLFQAKLGTLLDKSERLCVLMKNWVNVFNLSEADTHRAAYLSKCDLMTGMVGEFPELQGLMGYYYARHDGEAEAVASALNEQYMPRFAADELPSSALGRALSLAERLDTLVGAFAIGQRPTGVKDPFKLRRHALAVIRLLIAMPQAPALSTLIAQTLAAYGASVQAEAGSMEALRLFILERMFAYYEGQSISADLVQAVRARQEEVLFDLDKRLQALKAFVAQPAAISLSAACKRVNHLLHQAVATDIVETIDPTLFQEPAEQTLYQRIQTVTAQLAPLNATHDYEKALTELANLREPVDAFFEHVMVMVENQALKSNRLGMLAQLQALLQSVADFALLEVSKA
jgi:glycyl-tRNA synthetase beta chain